MTSTLPRLASRHASVCGVADRDRGHHSAGPSAIAQPAGTAPLKRASLGAIRGRITAADDGTAAAPGERVAPTGRRSDGPRPILTVTTNAQGVYEMRDVAPGSYFVSASRAGYIEIQHGQRRPRERGIGHRGRERRDARARRHRAAEGRSDVGTSGRRARCTLPRVTVIVLDVSYQLGERTYLPNGSAVTDDLGNYRISGMQPGRYYLQASSRETWRNEKKETLGYATTFFPGVPMLETAQSITLGISEEKINSDLMLVGEPDGARARSSAASDRRADRPRNPCRSGDR